MNLNLSARDIADLETRTEGWIAGLQLAAISMQGHKDHSDFIRSFTGGHRLVLDFLIEEAKTFRTRRKKLICIEMKTVRYLVKRRKV
jgi:hypothetical protein